MPRLQVHQQPHTIRVGALPQSHPGLCGTPVGPGKDTHGTPVPKQEGCGWPATTSTKTQTNDDKTQTSLKTDVLSAKPGVDTLGNLPKCPKTSTGPIICLPQFHVNVSVPDHPRYTAVVHTRTDDDGVVAIVTSYDVTSMCAHSPLSGSSVNSCALGHRAETGQTW